MPSSELSNLWRAILSGALFITAGLVFVVASALMAVQSMHWLPGVSAAIVAAVSAVQGGRGVETLARGEATNGHFDLQALLLLLALGTLLGGSLSHAL